MPRLCGPQSILASLVLYPWSRSGLLSSLFMSPPFSFVQTLVCLWGSEVLTFI
jgi:hypothetical protein